MSNRGKSGRVELLFEPSLTVLVGAGVTRVRARALAEALAAALAEALAAALAEALAAALALAEGPALGVAVGVTVTALLATLAEQMTRDPPPLAELLHWLTVTTWAEAIVPVAVQVSPTRVPPFADPLHWVIAAPVVLAGKGLQPVVIPPPDPPHWFTVTAVEPGLRL